MTTSIPEHDTSCIVSRPAADSNGWPIVNTNCNRKRPSGRVTTCRCHSPAALFSGTGTSYNKSGIAYPCDSLISETLSKTRTTIISVICLLWVLLVKETSISPQEFIIFRTVTQKWHMENHISCRSAATLLHVSFYRYLYQFNFLIHVKKIAGTLFVLRHKCQAIYYIHECSMTPL